MPLIQIQEGLLEQDNFYLTSSFSDFLGNGIYAKGIGYFELKQGEIKRNFPYKEFVIDVVKEEKQLGPRDQWFFFVEIVHHKTNELRKIGIRENQDTPAKYWRITCHDNFIQSYISHDGKTWINAGGYKLIDQEILYQGFAVTGDTSLVFTEYKVYHGPFVTLQNFEEHFKVELYDLEDRLIKTRLFNAHMQAYLFLDYNLEGYFKIYDNQNNLVYTSEANQRIMGSVYTYTPYELEMIHKGNVIGYGPTHLDTTIQLLQLKNVGTEAYHNLILSPLNATSDRDVIELSLDGITYGSKIFIDTLEVQQLQDLYVRITKEDIYDFVVNTFEIKIY